MFSRFVRLIALSAATVALTLGFLVKPVWAQSCCAGSSAITPGRLTPHEDALVGAQLRVQNAFGTFTANGDYVSAPKGTSEINFEEDVVGSLRVLRPVQISLLVPFVQTYRRVAPESEFGGGIGDLNVSVRYDILLAGQRASFPGIALLGGLSLPSGRAPERASTPLATGATGIGAFQGQLGIALEQTFSHWLLNAACIVAARTSREVAGVDSTLGPQVSTLLGAGYTFDNEAAIAMSLSYAFEMRSEINGQVISGTARRSPQLGLFGLVPLGDHSRLSGGPFVHLPFLPGANQTTYLGFSLTWVRTWS